MKAPGAPGFIRPRYSRCIEICLNFGTTLDQCRRHCRGERSAGCTDEQIKAGCSWRSDLSRCQCPDPEQRMKQKRWAKRSVRHLGKPLRIGHRDAPSRDDRAFVEPLTPYERRVALFGWGMDPTGM